MRLRIRDTKNKIKTVAFGAATPQLPFLLKFRGNKSTPNVVHSLEPPRCVEEVVQTETIGEGVVR